MNPVDLAYLYVRGATHNERVLINIALDSSPIKYSQKVRYYIQNPDLFGTDAELRKRFPESSQLEEKVK